VDSERPFATYKMPSKELKDKTLYKRIRSKDRESFIKAYDKHLDSIYRFVYFKVSDKETAEDITSYVFLKTWDYVNNDNLKDYKTLKSLLYKVARNLVIDHYRKASREMNVSLETEDGLIEAVDERQDLLKEAEIASDYEGLSEKMRELKDEYREAIILRYVNELSIAEIAEILEKSKGNVRVLIYRALNALKQIVKE